MIDSEHFTPHEDGSVRMDVVFPVTLRQSEPDVLARIQGLVRYGGLDSPFYLEHALGPHGRGMITASWLMPCPGGFGA